MRIEIHQWWYAQKEPETKIASVSQFEFCPEKELLADKIMGLPRGLVSVVVVMVGVVA